MSYARTLAERDIEASIERAAAGFDSLRAELMDALLNDPARRVLTPGWGEGVAPAFDVVIDEMAGRDSDEMRLALCQIVRMAATQKGDEKLQLAALRFLGRVADAHASFRSDDASSAAATMDLDDDSAVDIGSEFDGSLA